MSHSTAAIKQDLLLQEFAAELTPTPEELAEALGPAGKEQPAGAPGAARQEASPAARNLDMIMRIPVVVQVVLGSATMAVSGLVKLGRGAVIPLDRRVGEPVDVVVNGRVVARGEVVVMEEATSRFGISLTEVVTASGSGGGA
ncbi:MAG: flagellar motor switch protein FliN [Hyphomicrobiaceae bacterium]|nr:flagellar motor switch protein FliN [Hyphomicrobiaceae bacterium]